MVEWRAYGTAAGAKRQKTRLWSDYDDDEFAGRRYEAMALPGGRERDGSEREWGERETESESGSRWRW